MKILKLQGATLNESTLAPIQKNRTYNATREDALKILEQFDVAHYAKSRNSLDGGVSQLSIYVEHGLLDREDFLSHIEKSSTKDQAEPLLKQLYWREFFLQTYTSNPSMIWRDYEPYKTGYEASQYSDCLPLDIQNASTKIPLIDILVRELESSGYLHNHARLYLASYIVHFRRVKWQVGALWMLSLLCDGNLAVNNLSWQWVASTRSNKPYIFNWENIEKFAAKKYALKHHEHEIFDASYEELEQRLFARGKSNG